MLQKDDLIGIKNLCLKKYTKEKEDICFIILYGSAAKNFVDKKSEFSDFDINVFFKDSSKIKSTYGMPKKIGKYNGKEVEIMRNKLKNRNSWNDLINFMNRQRSKRWHSIRKKTVIGLYPEIVIIEGQKIKAIT